MIIGVVVILSTIIVLVIIPVIRSRFEEDTDLNSKTNYGIDEFVQSEGTQEYIENNPEEEPTTSLNEYFMWWYGQQNNLIQQEQALFIKTDFESKIHRALSFVGQGANNNSESSNKTDPAYDKELSELKDEFQRNIENFDDSSVLKTFNFTEPLDLPYWYNVVLTRTWNNLAWNEINPERKFKWQAEHIQIYQESLEEEYNVERISPEEKIELEKISAYRLLGFGNLFDLLEQKNEKLRLLNKKYSIKNNLEIEVSELIIAQAHASLYAACQFHMYLSIWGLLQDNYNIFESVSKYYKNFIPGQCLTVNQTVSRAIKELEDKKDS
jgi:hypothetical protein